ncbi:hypothetical protein [Stenotrophomonas sp. 9(2022)]|uniref:hypothetical protein n=1 Tax=Stenotrophomonas sp. 9(2022) TaxID=2950153 RepID=UPI00211495F1|nr:hypothetical protein [Stenotrophomonas sp. 9(2022)]
MRSTSPTIIDDLEPLLNQHRLIVDARAVKADAEACKGDEREQKYSLMYQLTRITKDRGCLRHDDRIDALAHGVRWFRESLRVDAEKAEREHLKAAEDARWAARFDGRGGQAGSVSVTRSRHR